MKNSPDFEREFCKVPSQSQRMVSGSDFQTSPCIRNTRRSKHPTLPGTKCALCGCENLHINAKGTSQEGSSRFEYPENKMLAHFQLIDQTYTHYYFMYIILVHLDNFGRLLNIDVPRGSRLNRNGLMGFVEAVSRTVLIMTLVTR